MFIYHFLISNIIISVFIGVIFLLKKIFGDRLSVKCNYLMWYAVILIMLFSFVPTGTGFELNIGRDYNSIVNIREAVTNINGTVKDLYVSVNRSNLLYYIWVFGVLVNIIIFIVAFIKLRGFLRYKVNCHIFTKCCEKIGVKADLYLSDKINSPISFGIIRPIVVVNTVKYSETQLEHIFIHELLHHKKRDIWINYILCILRAFYWFNPIVSIAFKRFKLDMEICCDYNAIRYLGNSAEYGSTIINLCAMKSQFKFVSYMASYKKDIKKRIIRIANINKKYSVYGTRVIACVIAITTLFSASIINCFGYSVDTYSKNLGVESIDLSSYFMGYEGCFVLYDINKDSYTVYNENMARKRVSPDSTYKIAIALNSLEKAVITRDNNIKQWGGEDYPFEEWNKNQDLFSAMKNSVNWYFQDLDRGIETKDIRKFLERVSYGNCSVGYNKDEYWLESELKISPMEQVEFLKGVYNNKFGLNQYNIDTVLETINIDNGFYGKTGTGMVNGKITNGWFIGIINKNEKSYIFALRIEGNEGGTGGKAKNIAENIIENL